MHENDRTALYIAEHILNSTITNVTVLKTQRSKHVSD